MSWISDEALERLRAAGGEPGLGGTRYRLVREVGRGGMGTVYLADDLELERRVALKVVAEHLGEDGAGRLRREARVLGRLEHAGIVPVHDAGTLPDGRAFYAMKYVDGERLDRHMSAAAPLHERLAILVRIGEAVALAHERGVLHRDLKPANVMVGSFGEVLVLDWGVAKALEEGRGARDATGVPTPGPGRAARPRSGETAPGTVVGTPGWMAPEQARGEGAALGPRIDVWGLGGVLLWLLARREPGRGLGPRPPDVPRPLWAICRRALAPDPEERYGCAQALVADVRAFLAQEPVAAWPEGPLRRARRLLAKHQTLAWLVLAYLVARVLVFLWQPGGESG